MKKNDIDLDTPETTPERLHRARRRLGLTQKEMAIRCGVNDHTIRDAEREPKDRAAEVTLKSFNRIAEGTGIPAGAWL